MSARTLQQSGSATNACSTRKPLPATARPARTLVGRCAEERAHSHTRFRQARKKTRRLRGIKHGCTGRGREASFLGTLLQDARPPDVHINVMFECNDVPLDFHAPLRNGRRGGRVSTKFWLRVTGWDSEPIVRSGDLGATGLFITTGDPFGGPGDVAMLELESIDHTAKLRSLARVARVLRQDDRKFGARVVGIAFEFLPLETIQPGAANLVRHAVRQELVRHGHVRLDDPALVQVRGGDSTVCERAMLLDLGVEQITLQTTKRISYGSRFTIELPHDSGVLTLSGEAVSSQPVADVGSSTYSTLVHLLGPLEERQSLLVDLAERLVVPEDYEPPPESGFDFSGELGSVGVDQLLQLVSHRCYSGVLSIANERSCFSIQISQGEVTSLEGNDPDSAASIEALRALQTGEFRFRNRRSPRLSLISPGTAQLLENVMSTPAETP